MSNTYIKGSLLTGFLILASIHWGGLLLSALLEQVLTPYVEAVKLPWLRILLVGLEIIVAIDILNRVSAIKKSSELFTYKLLILALLLFVAAQFIGWKASFPTYCLTKILSNEIDGYCTAVDMSNAHVRIIETCTLGIALLLYALNNHTKEPSNE